MTRPKKGEPHSTNPNAVYMRKKREQMVKQDPLALRSTVWIVEGSNGKQLVFKDRKDITITRIPKQKMKVDCIKAF